MPDFPTKARTKPEGGTRLSLKNKNLKITLGAFVIVLAIVYLVFSGLSTATASYYTTVEEALSGKAEPGKHYRIEGKIDVSQAIYDAKKTPVELKFQIYDEKKPEQKLTVIYNDVKPDNFSEATAAVVDGTFNADGTFHADTLTLKCPSKYEQAAPTANEGVISRFLRSLGLKK